MIRPVRIGEVKSSRTTLPAMEKGVLYRSVKGGCWQSLLRIQATFEKMIGDSVTLGID
jgi:hypothetical protein